MMPYILQVALVTSILWIFYRLLLQRETFFRLNRVFLFSGLMFSFLLPLVPVPEKWSLQSAPTEAITTAPTVEILPAAGGQEAKISRPQASPPETRPLLQRVVGYLPYLYWIGVLVFGLNLLLQLSVLFYQIATRPSIKDGKYRILEVSGDKAPCSFGNWIFINPDKYDWETYNLILLHEKIHINQRHSIDFLLTELCMVFQWFNPFVWAYRRTVESNIEFLADHSLLGVETVEQQSYQLSLLKVSAPHMPLGITTNYNQSLLKKRVHMMNAKKSSIGTAWKYLFVFPLLTLLIITMNKPVAIAQDQPPVRPIASGPADFKNISSGKWTGNLQNDALTLVLTSTTKGGNFSTTRLFARSEMTNTSGGFDIRREAGVLQCSGTFAGTSGSGAYKFLPTSDFKATLARYGITNAEEGSQFVLFLSNINTPYLAFLQQNGYAHLSIAELQDLGLQNFSLDELQSYIGSARSAGTAPVVPVDRLVAMKTSGVTPAYINSIRHAGYTSLSLDEFFAARMNGIDSAYIRSLQASGHKDLSIDEVILSKQRASGNGADIKGEPQSLLNNPMESGRVGGRLDVEYGNQLKRMGYTGLSSGQVHAARTMGLNEDYVNALKTMHYSGLPFDKVLALKTMTVTPTYIESFNRLGYIDIPVNTLIRLRTHRVDPGFIQEFSNLGFKDIPLDLAIQLKIFAVSPEYILAKKQSGANYATLQEYLALKQKGS
jgi:hypothetical protein